MSDGRDSAPSPRPGPRGPTIGILSPYLTGHYYGSLISAIVHAVSSAGGRVAAIQAADDAMHFVPGTMIGRLAPVGWRRLSGFVIIANAAPLYYLEALRDAGKPVVTLAHEEPGFACPAVVVDNRSGVAQAAEHLLGHGHTRIAFAGFLEQFDVLERYAGYREALMGHGIEPDPALFFEATGSLEADGVDVGRRMVALGLPSSAVVASTDMVAVGIMSALKEAGCRLPQDQAVTGFDDTPGAALLSPSLSSISQNSQRLGGLAVELLLRQLAGEQVEPKRYTVASSYIPRESCGCVGPVDSTRRSERLGSGDAVTDFTEAVSRAPGKHGAYSAARVAKLASELDQLYRAAAGGDLAPAQLLRVGQACEEIYACVPSQDTYDAVLDLASRLSAQRKAAGGLARGAAARFAECGAAARLGLTKSLLGERSVAYYDLRKAIRDEFQIGISLLDHAQDPASLDWLGQTNAHAAVLGLWRRPETGADAERSGAGELPARAGSGYQAEAPEGKPLVAVGRLLDVAGTFHASRGRLAVSSQCLPVESFPPEELLELAGEGMVVSMMQVRSAGDEWGYIAIAAPVDSNFIGQDTYFTWLSMFSEALSYQALMRRLRDKSDDLENSYQRERDMAQAIRASEERYALAAKAANDGLWDWDLDMGTIYFSSRWKQMLGYSGTVIGNNPEEWLGRVHPDDREGVLTEIAALKVGERGFILNEHRVRTSDETYTWVLCRGLAVPGHGSPATRIVGSLTDITERRGLEERLRHQALYDSLTGLPNRVLFLDRLSQAINNAKRRPGFSYTVLWLDLDNFKNLNDSLGHAFGDKLLVQVAERIRGLLRESDTAARFGGDEFALLLQDVPDVTSVGRIVRRLLTNLAEPYDLEGHEVVVTGSLGVATSTTGYDQPEDVLRDADIAMYRAKATERGSYATFDASMHATAIARLQTETELRQAIDASPLSGQPRLLPEDRGGPASMAPVVQPGRQGTPGDDLPDQGQPQDAERPGSRANRDGHLELHYQPVVDLGTGAVVALEALVRWRHPLLGLVPPLQFLQVAEDSGLIVPMGRWVESEACRQLARWHASALLSAGARVGVNLSNREFWSPRFLEHLDRVLGESGVRPDLLAFEITEGVIMDDLDSALDVLQELHARQVQVHVDDFGTGYSSLQALHRLPIDVLKIDKSFVAGLVEDDRTVELVRTIVNLGKSIGVGVIAEGVETAVQHDVLAGLGCPWGQGFLFSPALPADELEALLAGGRLPLEGSALGLPLGGL